MSKRAKHQNVAAKPGLNRAILDQSWYEFRRQLAYKLAWNGGFLFTVPPQNTSRCCPSCGHTAKDNRQTQSVFECVECGYQNNADVVGAINVLKRGQALQAEWPETQKSIRTGRVRSACEVNNAVRLSAARTHRSDLPMA